MVNKNINKIINESLRLIKYDRLKILSEQSDATYVDNSLEKSLPKLLDSDRYPNYCRYPEKAFSPPDPYGDGGLIEDEDSGLKYCFYQTASKNGKPQGKFIPSEAEIVFTDDLEFYDKMVEKLVDKYGIDESYAETVMTEIFPQGVVRSFTINNQTYNAHIKREGEGPWEFAGYFRKGDGELYVSPKKVDPRNEYQKFIDEWGLVLQLGAVFATAIAGALSGGAGWVLTAEILLELGIGTMVGLRELEKGQNVMGILSFITGLIPMLKLSKAFKGISEASFTSLSTKLKNSGLTKSSSFRDYLKFYRTLDPEEQKILSQLLNQDEIARTQLWNEIKVALDSEIPKMVMDTVRKNPKILRDLKFWDKLWARELTTNGVVGIIGLSVEILFGEQLNDQEKVKLYEIYNKIPDEHKKEFAYNVATNGKTAMRALQKIDVTKVPKKGTSQAMSKWYNDEVKKQIEDEGGTYTELPEDPNVAVDVVANERKKQQMRKEGWVPQQELNDREFFDYVKISGEKWYKIN
jgi:hypothetical protein